MGHTFEGVVTRLLVCSVTIWCGTVWPAEAQPAAPPAPIPYSGVITDAANRPVMGSIPVVFALYIAPVGGVELWVEVQTVQTDAGGHFQARLGATTAFPARLRGWPSLWLGVQSAGLPEQRRVPFSFSNTGAAQEGAGTQQAPDDHDALRVFLDCEECDSDYLRQQITFLNYVVDRQDAQVHVLVTTQPTGGGTEFTFAFIGLESFAGRDDEVRYGSSNTDTEDEQRGGIARTLQLGLLPYLAGTPLARQVEIFHDPDAGLGAAQPQDDPWNFWVFQSNADAKLSGQASETDRSVSGSFSASRTTEGWQIELGASSSYAAATSTWETAPPSSAPFGTLPRRGYW